MPLSAPYGDKTMKRCFDCGKTLESTGEGPGWMNSEQWDASKAGDYFATCDKASHENGNCYFNDTRGVETLKRLPKRAA
jgi:hypothetical protein